MMRRDEPGFDARSQAALSPRWRFLDYEIYSDKLEDILASHTTKKVEPRKRAANGEPGKTAGSHSRGVDDIVSLVGQKVADMRRAKSLSLQQLAEISEVSPAAIHKIERSGMVPTITTLLKLAAALGVSVSYFIDEGESPPEPVHYTPANQRPRIFTSHEGLSLAGITGSYQKFQTAAAIAQMAPDASSGEKALRHAGEELVHVLSGKVFFWVNGREYILSAGDSLQFNGNLPHRWENNSKIPAHLIWMAVRNRD